MKKLSILFLCFILTKEVPSMKNFGQTFKFIRENKSISQEQASKDIMSRSNLSRFEQGSYAIAYSTFIELLQRIDIPYDEFIYIHQKYQLSEKEQLYTALVNADMEENISMIKSISERAFQELENGHLEYELLFFTAQTALHTKKETTILTTAEMKLYIQKRLIETDRWFMNDFRLLNNFLVFFDTEEICYFIGRAIDEFKKYEHITIKNNVYAHLLLNAGTILFERNLLDQSTTYLVLAQQAAIKQNKLLQLLLAECYLSAIALTKNKQSNHAKKDLSMRINILKSWGYHDLATNLEKLLLK